jgi:hypothetical protein
MNLDEIIERYLPLSLAISQKVTERSIILDAGTGAGFHRSKRLGLWTHLSPKWN